jgi:hypothetical protein
LHFQHRTRRHAFDWETNSRQIERAIQNLLTRLL